MFQKVIDKIEEMIKEGNRRRIIINDVNGDLFIEMPLLVGVIITIAAPYVIAIGTFIGYLSKFSVELGKKQIYEDAVVIDNENLTID